MRCHSRTAVALALALTCVAACSSDAETSAATGPGTTPAVAPASTVAAAFAPTHSVACDSDLQTMQLAVDAYLALYDNGKVTEAAIVTAGLLRAESTLHDVEPDGTIVPAPGSVCLD